MLRGSCRRRGDSVVSDGLVCRVSERDAVGVEDSSLVRKRGACLVEDKDRKRVLLVREIGNNNITYNS